VVNSVLWRASEVDNPQRKFFSINPEINHTHQGIKLSWGNLNTLQKKQLKANATDEIAKKRLAWLLGSKRNEGEQFRKRAHYLGDIVGSNISVLSDQKDYGHSVLKGDQGKLYPSFLRKKSNQKQAIFVGANDGALHAFNTVNGTELFAYVPNTVLPKIAMISQPNYGCKSLGCLPHEFLVDGQTTVADAYFDDRWHTILVGSLGLGGKGIYALEVSDVEDFNEKDVLWEISTQYAPINSESYKKHLGFVNQEASIVRLKSGRWVVIVGNGFGSAKHQAVLFIIDLQTGHLIKSLNTQVGSVNQPNGLSTPISIDTNDDNNVDRIYAGDLLGNVWRFDLANSDPSQWSVAFAGKPLFHACEDAACKKPQAITAKLQVGNHPEGGVMVYFGTHQSSAKQASSVNSFYAIRDNNSRVVSTKNLIEQQILQENSVGTSLEMRVTSNLDVDYKQKQGWMLKLKRAFSQATGERVRTQALLREGQLLITSEIPLGESCAAHQSRWLMKLDALQGKRLKLISFDTNHDNKLTGDDNAFYERQPTIVSGVHLNDSGVMAATPVILRSGKHSESLLSIKDDGTLKTLKTSATHSSGRVSWRQLR
jgi:type IV pilus assembly protein PilY1